MFSACKLSALIVAQAVVIAAGRSQGWTALAHLDDSGVYDDDALRSCPGGKCVYMKSRNGWIQAGAMTIISEKLKATTPLVYITRKADWIS
ncbi:hypothetical protein FA13DRAFT_1728625 [Coprinellus micaceus]|uniref:Secreted protein n=1 Tax=Coprinellus micaceus TaxID=71717 RepID=A0A4Y7TNL0_COPMI|nr:hypothetical protein FA13DRAFT_1728625 [Coprinellus micaceus]